MRVATQTVDESDGQVSVVAATEWPSGMTVWNYRIYKNITCLEKEKEFVNSCAFSAWILQAMDRVIRHVHYNIPLQMVVTVGVVSVQTTLSMVWVLNPRISHLHLDL